MCEIDGSRSGVVTLGSTEGTLEELGSGGLGGALTLITFDGVASSKSRMSVTNSFRDQQMDVQSRLPVGD